MRVDLSLLILALAACSKRVMDSPKCSKSCWVVPMRTVSSATKAAICFVLWQGMPWIGSDLR